jgi:serine/threonine protein kinase
MVEWARVQRLRGRHIEDPIKEIAAMQLLGNGNPHVLGSTEVLQDDNYLYSVMRYCRGGDLFGVVVKYSEEEAGEGGEAGRMPEPMVRYWFRQILKVR